jgi:hypothetical protein
MAKNIQQYVAQEVAQEVIKYAENRDHELKEKEQKIEVLKENIIEHLGDLSRFIGLSYLFCSTCFTIECWSRGNRFEPCYTCRESCCTTKCNAKVCINCTRLYCESCWQKWTCEHKNHCNSCCYCE